MNQLYCLILLSYCKKKDKKWMSKVLMSGIQSIMGTELLNNKSKQHLFGWEKETSFIRNQQSWWVNFLEDYKDKFEKIEYVVRD